MSLSSGASRLLWKAVVQGQSRKSGSVVVDAGRTTIIRRCLSSSNEVNSTSTSSDFQQKYPLEAGEWDAEGTDPMSRPAWKNPARIMSPEDFANRPKVGFAEEFSSMHDGMVVLSWLNAQTKDEMYSMYLELLEQSPDVSMEYIVRVVAQKFHVSPMRAAAVIDQCHTEERMKAAGQELHQDAQDYADAKIQQHITDAYAASRERNPNTDVPFVEDVIAAAVESNSTTEQIVGNDLIQLNTEESSTNPKQTSLQKAKRAIATRLYPPNQDPSQTFVPITSECETLIQRQNQEFPTPYYYNDNLQEDDSTARRPRWKFVAKTISTNQQKKQSKNKKRRKTRKEQSKTQNLQNTLVEHNGTLRVATIQEASSTAWKSKRNVMEFTLANVQQAWMDYQNGTSKKGAWGRAPPPPPTTKKATSQPKNDEEDESQTEKKPTIAVEIQNEESRNDENDKN